MAARVLFPAALLCSVLMSAAADEQGADKPYTLFMGADIFVGQGGEAHPVRDVSGGSWVVQANGQSVLVSSKAGPISMKIVPSHKLTMFSASISKLQAETAYTFANDPAVKMTRALNQAADVSAGTNAAMNQSTALTLGDITGADSGTSTSAVTQSATSGSSNGGKAVNFATGSVGGDVSFFNAGKDDTGNFDALNVSFDISAGRSLNAPYIVMITRFHEKGAEEGTFRNLVYAKALEPIDKNVSSVHFQQAGFPPGFQIRGFEIHLYNLGEEVATNVAPKRESLTTDQAFDYVKTAYLKAHKADTMGSTPVLAGSLPMDLQDRLAQGMFARTVYVRVSKDGLPIEGYLDAACSKRVEDPYLKSVVQSIRFKPALSSGTPVEGTATVNLGLLRP